MTKSEKTLEGQFPITIRSQDFVLPVYKVPLKDLRYYQDNPRVYSALHNGEDAPGQEEIEAHLQADDHVRELKVQIEENGGLAEVLFVRAATMEVVEGNSRLAAYRLLEKKNAITWSQVRCALLPPEINDSLVMSLLSLLHLTGKKSWIPYEQAAIFHRRFNQEKIPISELAKETQLKDSHIQHRIAVIQSMIDAGDNQLSRWSYYDELLKSRIIQKACKTYPGLKDEIIDRIKRKKIERAQDIRDKLKVVCGGEKTIKQFLNGTSLNHAFENAQSSSGDNKVFAKVNQFRVWLADTENKSLIKNLIKTAPKTKKESLLFDLGEIKRHVESLRKGAGK